MVEKDGEQSSSQTQPESRWGKLYRTIAGPLAPWLLALFAAAIGAFFQVRSWSYQNNVAQIKADTQSVLDTGPKVTGLTTERYSAALQLVKALNGNPGGEALKAAQERVAAAKKEWELRFTDLLSQLKFYVDAPFDIDDDNRLKQAAEVKCTKYTLYMLPQEAASNRPYPTAFLLAVLNRCHADLDDAIDPAKTAKTAADQKSRDEWLKSANMRLEHLWHVGNVLHCVIDGRALQIRRSQGRVSSIGALFGSNARDVYDAPPEEPNCLRDYKENKTLGITSLARE